MANLKQEHPVLYKRVRYKAVFHILLGSILILLPNEVGVTQRSSKAVTVVPLWLWGAIYVIIGVFIVIGIYKSRHDYKFGRNAMTAAGLYSIFWEFLLIVNALGHNTKGTFWAVTVYGLITLNIWDIRNDPGWKGARLAKEVLNDIDTRSKRNIAERK